MMVTKPFVTSWFVLPLRPPDKMERFGRNSRYLTVPLQTPGSSSFHTRQIRKRKGLLPSKVGTTESKRGVSRYLDGGLFRAEDAVILLLFFTLD